MILPFAGATAKDIYDVVDSKAARRIPKSAWLAVSRKLDAVNAATSTADLANLPGNRGGGEPKGRRSVPPGPPYRIAVRFAGGHSMALPKNRPPTHPGEMLLEEFLKPLELTQAEAARHLKMPLNRLNELVKGKRGVTPDTALRLSELFQVSPEFWMNLQAGWDLWHVQYERKASGEAGSIKAIAKAR